MWGLRTLALLPSAFTHTSDCFLSEFASAVFAVYTDMSPLFNCLAAMTRALQLGLCRRISLIFVRNSSDVF